MPIKHAIWQVSNVPRRLIESTLPSEKLLEEMIVSDCGILSEDWMVIGRQELAHAGILDLVAIAPDGSLILIELKRDRTPREVVAQALDYASWIETLAPEAIDQMFDRFSGGKKLAAEFKKRFGRELEYDAINLEHEIIIVAASLDDSTERIVRYLSDRGISINAIFFQVFVHGDQQFLSRAWLIDPTETQLSTVSKNGAAKEPWNGEFYCSFGEGPERSWDEARKFGFISAGGGAWYSRTLKSLAPGDRIWVNIPERGYVGTGTVLGARAPLRDFTVSIDGNEAPASVILTKANYHRQHEDTEREEFFVPVKWAEAVALDKAFTEPGLFGNQNSACKPTTPRWRKTVDRLKSHFTNWQNVDHSTQL